MGIGKILENLPNGLQTELSKEFSSEGVELSGGEWQKLAISRGVFRNAEVIVLDPLFPMNLSFFPHYLFLLNHQKKHIWNHLIR